MTTMNPEAIECQDVETSQAAAELMELGAASTETRGNYAGLIQETSFMPWRFL